MHKYLLVFAVITTSLSCGTGVYQTFDQTPGLSEAAMRGGCRTVCPKCRHGEVCPMMACRIECPSGKTACGPNLCQEGQVCCNESCGICANPGDFCIDLACAPVALAGCQRDADCRLFSDYCTGCDCRALLTSDPDPMCESPGVRCFADPCAAKTAVCDAATGSCVAQ